MKQTINIFFLTFILFFFSCKNKRDAGNELIILERESISEYNEGDTLQFIQPASAFQRWMDWHQQFDSKYSNASFKASGVSIHFEEMEAENATDTNSLIKELFIYSPDSSKYLDLYSYGFFKENNKVFSGEIDQMILIGNNKNILARKQVMFLGSSQTAEFAEWVSNNSFLIGLNSINESGDSSQYEIFLFNLNKSIYTNFVLDHKIPVIPTSFIEMDINSKMHTK